MPEQPENFAKRPAAKLCAYCQDMFGNWQPELDLYQKQTIQHYKSYEDVCQSANNGCGFCYQLQLGFEYVTHGGLGPLEGGNLGEKWRLQFAS